MSSSNLEEVSLRRSLTYTESFWLNLQYVRAKQNGGSSWKKSIVLREYNVKERNPLNTYLDSWYMWRSCCCLEGEMLFSAIEFCPIAGGPCIEPWITLGRTIGLVTFRETALSDARARDTGFSIVPRDLATSCAVPIGIFSVFSTRIFLGRPRFSAGLEIKRLSIVNVKRCVKCSRSRP